MLTSTLYTVYSSQISLLISGNAHYEKHVRTPSDQPGTASMGLFLSKQSHDEASETALIPAIVSMPIILLFLVNLILL